MEVISPNPNSANDLTVMVFKDNHSSRSFKVPFRWISLFSMIAGTFLLLALISIIFSLKTFISSDQASFRRIIDAQEAELYKLKEDFSSLQSRYKVLTQGEGGVASNASTGMLFTGLPSQVRPLDTSLANNIEITDKSVSWSGQNLEVAFNINYNQKDGGSQKGRILVLGRGLGTFASYPPEAINPQGSESLIDPQKGEFFSVSRFRAVKASLGTFSARNKIQTVEIILFGTNFETLYYAVMPVEGSSGKDK